MYAVSKEGVFAGYADSVVSIRPHENGSYVPCADDEADGFCAKMARELTTEDDEGRIASSLQQPQPRAAQKAAA